MIAPLIALLISQMTAEPPPLPATYEDALKLVRSDSACEGSEYPELGMLFMCEANFTGWYFTVPSDELPPGFVRRTLVRDGQAIKMLTHAIHFGTDAQETAFVEWQAAIARSIQ